MIQPGLRHFVYGNPAGTDGHGFRVIQRPAEWPEKATTNLETWLRQLQPPPAGAEPGLATAAFRIGGQLYACLARVESGFGQDCFGREGTVLVHLLALPVAEEQDAGLHAATLVAQAAQLRQPRELPDGARLRAYLEQAAAMVAPPVPPPYLRALLTLGEGALRPFLHLAAALLPPAPPPPITPLLALLPPPRRSLAEVLALLTGALPPRLRLALRWGTGIGPRGVSLLGVTADGTATTTPTSGNDDAEEYADWLLARLVTRDAAALQAVLANWQLRSWKDLLRATEVR